MDRLSFFSECLKDILLENNLSIKQLSEATGITLSRLYDFTSGLHAPSLKSAMKIAEFTKCSLDFLFGFSSEGAFKSYNVDERIILNVKGAIDESKISRYRLHKITGISEPQISRWYNGKQTPTLVSLIALAEAINCSLDFIVGKQ